MLNIKHFSCQVIIKPYAVSKTTSKIVYQVKQRFVPCDPPWITKPLIKTLLTKKNRAF